MSHAKSSAMKWFEYLLEDTRKKLARIRRRGLPIWALEKLVNLGDMVFPRIVYTAERIANLVNKLQLTMIESMILASLWSGIILLVLAIIVTLVKG